MNWHKLGLILEPTGREWMVSHAQNPFAEALGGSAYKVHFAGRDRYNQARGGWVTIDVNHPTHPLEVSAVPSLDLGQLGCFDDCGAMPSCVVDAQGASYMYYTGWSRADRTPFTFFIGLAVSEDQGKSYRRYSEAPVLGRTRSDPLMTASPWVMRDGDRWRMWYVSCVRWETAGDELKHYYHIRHADSADGITWRTDGTVCIDFADDEYAIARPVVSRSGDVYSMWYCYRGGERAYRAGYAESRDGISWERKDGDVGIDVSVEGWDSEMICYPAPLEHDGAQYLLYNGNDYGRTGVGIAVRQRRQ